MRCFEIDLYTLCTLIPPMLNNNMRCFEMKRAAKLCKSRKELNNNMRCFEINTTGGSGSTAFS